MYCEHGKLYVDDTARLKRPSFSPSVLLASVLALPWLTATHSSASWNLCNYNKRIVKIMNYKTQN